MMKEKSLAKLLLGDWYTFLKEITETPYFSKLMEFLNSEYIMKVIYPDKKKVFKVFKSVTPINTRVVILGQDPYFNGSATGLAFANNDNVLISSLSLQKIVEKLEEDYQMMLSYDITLESWAKQGIMLLNTALTVEKYKPNSHSLQWSKFTEFIIKKLSEEKTGLIFCLWGDHAKKYKSLINEKKHYILEAEHPLYADKQNRLWKCNHFKKINEIIKDQNGIDFKINW